MDVKSSGHSVCMGMIIFGFIRREEGELTFTEDSLACAIPETAAPNTHKDSWKAVTAGRKDLRGIPWNYFPRGRVEISRGWALVFMNPQILNCENYLERIREKFEMRKYFRPAQFFFNRVLHIHHTPSILRVLFHMLLYNRIRII